MSFTSYSSIGEAAQAFGITLRSEDFLTPLPMHVSEALRADLAFDREHVAFDKSEVAVSECLIYPILREVWRHYTDALTVWSHTPIDYDAELSGTPDYFVAKKSRLGHWVLDKPYVLVMEAKKDDFSRGWGQCLAAMLAAQKLNERPGVAVHGITTTGKYWEFARLHDDVLTRNNRTYILDDLDTLCSAVNFVFDQCRRQVVDPSKAA